VFDPINIKSYNFRIAEMIIAYFIRCKSIEDDAVIGYML
jgi:hypothetical protein